MPKTKYWMSDGYGHVALIEGAEERDRWKPLGWAETEEPAPGVQVWMRHEVHGGHALFPQEVAHLWQQKGWQPSEPPPPVDPFNAANPADVAAPPPAAPAATPTAPAPAGRTNTSTKEQQADG